MFVSTTTLSGLKLLKGPEASVHRIEIDFPMHLYNSRKTLVIWRPPEVEHGVTVPQGGKSCDRRILKGRMSLM